MRCAGRPVDVANRHPRLRLDRGRLEAAVAVLDRNARRFLGGCPEGFLSVALMTDRSLARLHARYLGDPSATDVITFAGDAAHRAAGEICVSVDAAARRAGRSRAALSRELTLYVVHGWLHLAGYDDASPASKRAMRRAEARAMRLLARSGATPRFKLA
jgi:probable rRNA maturation factor